jgi:Uncharacterized protein conserved in bacteria
VNADAFRHLYGYHFSENRKIWENYIRPLTLEQYLQESGYSQGSVRNQLVHMMNVDRVWFSELRNVELPELKDPEGKDNRMALRAAWDGVEREMRESLAGLQDETLFTRPITEEEDKALLVWQVLLHGVNHGTDHRAQLLRQLNDLGVKTGPEDYIFYAYDHPMPD